MESFKVAMRLAYNGIAFYGFQNQKNVASVHQTLQTALKSVGIDTTLVGSGRTDKGVHASAQVVSLRVPHYWKHLESLRTHLNAKLYPNLFIKRIWRVSDDFHASLSAKGRGYCYVLSNGYTSPFLTPFTTPFVVRNPSLLRDALKKLVGEHNFSAFMKKGGCGDGIGVKSVRTLYRASLRQYKGFWIFSFYGSGFLRAQVRLMVGFLLEIDRGNLSLEDLEAQLKGKILFRIPAPPNGLFLTRVDY